MKLLSTTLLLVSASIAFVSSAEKITKNEYVEQWKDVAMEQMVQYNIPASITLAQGILESGSGNSVLAIKGNNHFGIKCHGWEGKKIYIDDDRDNECFRVYKNAKESFQDHSDFLNKYSRYEFLFTYDLDDYKSWAKGLKQAGYATNPKYPQLLIDIIEDLGLNKYDKGGRPEIINEPSIVVKNEVNTNSHQVKSHENGVKYIVARSGDTFYRISKEFGLKLNQLYRYNNFKRGKDVLENGDVIYIQPKRRGNLFIKEKVLVQEDISIIELSQAYATNIKAIRRMNDFAKNDETIDKGSTVTLR